MFYKLSLYIVTFEFAGGSPFIMIKPNDSQTKTTDFGFQQIPISEKTAKVAGIFDAVANKYDLMNDLMSFGIHRLWKRFAIYTSGVRPGQIIGDLAGGTGDLTYHLAKRVGDRGLVTLIDINSQMLQIGRNRLIERGLLNNIRYVQANAEVLPFPNDYFDLITMAFGLRNVTHKAAALAEINRVLKPGGQLLILEFSKPTWPGLPRFYDFYSFKILPLLGRWVANDAQSYHYLAESIRMHPDQLTLKNMLLEAGFSKCDYHNLSGGIVALHRGTKW